MVLDQNSQLHALKVANPRENEDEHKNTQLSSDRADLLRLW
jgi:hypothetical protein